MLSRKTGNELRLARHRSVRQEGPLAGFTLVEILIVISIIAILMSMVVGALSIARSKANEASARTMVQNLSSALDKFYEDESYYPGSKVDPDINAFPQLFEALLGERKSKGGKGGRSAPYLEVKEDQIVVIEDDTNPDNIVYRKASPDERWDPDVEKFIRGPFGDVIWYRVNKNRERENYMHRPRKFDLWDLGPDRKNHTIPGSEPEGEEENDDIGNW